MEVGLEVSNQEYNTQAETNLGTNLEKLMFDLKNVYFDLTKVIKLGQPDTCHTRDDAIACNSDI